MKQEVATLAPAVRAEQALAFADTKAKLVTLAQQSVRIVEITGKPGYDECHSARMSLKNTRVDIQRRGKEAREDATAFSKAVIAKEKELIDTIEPEEKRLQVLQDAWDSAREAERLSKIQAETDRINSIRSSIAAITDEPVLMFGNSAEVIRVRLDCVLGELPSPEYFQDFYDQAVQAHTNTVAKLETMLAAQVAHEAEQEQIRKDREELARLQREAADREAEAERAAADARAEADRLAQVERDRLAAVERQRIQAEADEREAQEAIERAERMRQEDLERAEREEAERVRRAEAEAERQAQLARDAADRQRLADERAELQRQRAAAEAATRKREIANATLRGTTAEARDRLIELGDGETLLVAKLAAVLKMPTDDQEKAA